MKTLKEQIVEDKRAIRFGVPILIIMAVLETLLAIFDPTYIVCAIALSGFCIGVCLAWLSMLVALKEYLKIGGDKI